MRLLLLRLGAVEWKDFRQNPHNLDVLNISPELVSLTCPQAAQFPPPHSVWGCAAEGSWGGRCPPPATGED